MSTSHDPVKILLYLAECLDIRKTLEAFPGTTREDLRELLIQVAGSSLEAESPFQLWVDGASRGNPGQAGAGFVLKRGTTRIMGHGEYIGEATNNEAEYRALILGMTAAGRQGLSELDVRSDSKLMIQQMRGEYRVRNPRLQELYFQAVRCMGPFKKVTFTHVGRDDNREADRLANMAIDAKGNVDR